MERPVVKRAHAISALKKNEEAVRKLGARALFLYGSTARNQADENSDVDIFIEYDEDSKFSLMELVAIQLYLQDRLAVPVDIATRDGLHPYIREQIEAEAICIF